MRSELGEKYKQTLLDYISYRFVGQYMDRQIKGTFADLPWLHIGFATDFSGTPRSFAMAFSDAYSPVARFRAAK